MCFLHHVAWGIGSDEVTRWLDVSILERMSLKLDVDAAEVWERVIETR